MSDKSLSLEQTRHVAKLSKLEYSEEELLELNREMARILESVTRLDGVPTDGLEATLAVGAYANRFREDVTAPGLPREAVLQNAPCQRDGCFEITRIISRIDE